MNPLLITPVLEIGKTLIERFFPDKEKAAEAEREFLRMAFEGELRATIAQLEINAKEAANPSVWVSGWRPGFGWCCALGFMYAVMLQPLLAWFAAVKGWPVPPVLESELLWTVTTGMLGIGALRSAEKFKGVTK